MDKTLPTPEDKKRSYVGDLKPENIFFDSQAVLKLGDFGLAKFSMGTADHNLQSESGMIFPSALLQAPSQVSVPHLTAAL